MALFKKIILVLVSSPLLVLAAARAAATATKKPTLGSLITDTLTLIIRPLGTLLLAAAVVVFFWGVVKYMSSLGDEKKRADGKYMMAWGIVALFVMVSVWGLVAIITNTLGLDNTTPTNIVIPASTS